MSEAPVQREESWPEQSPGRRLRAVDPTPGSTAEPAAPGIGAGDLEAGEREPGPQDTGVPVDPPVRRPTAAERYRQAREAQTEPVLPEWLASWQGLREAARWAGAYYGRRAGYRGLRFPVDVLRWSGWGLAGLARAVGSLTKWMADVDGHPLVGTIKAESDRAYVKMAADRARRQKARLLLVTVLAGLATITGLVVWFWAPVWVGAIVAGLLVVGLVRNGKPVDKPVLSGVSVVKAVTPRLTSHAIATALGGLGIAAVSQAVARGRTAGFFPKPVQRVKTGWLAEIDLPHGVTAAELAERRAKLASGLRRPLGAVWPEGDAGVHEGRVRLYVLDKPLSEMPQPAWPLATAGRANVFQPLPYGYDPKGDAVRLPLMYSNLLVGAIPRQGKTFAVRVVVLGAALDPTVEVHAHELKGTGDLECVQAIAHRYTSGPAREVDLQSVMASIREVYGYLEPRALTISRLGKDRCPESKVTRQLAADRSLGLHPVLLVIDEVQELFDSDYRDEAEQLLKAIIKRGPALGIMLILSTQKPDAKSLPTGISSNMGLRLCLRVGDQVANDMILGTSAYRMGLNATLFTDSDRGVGLLREGGASARTVRSSYLDAAAADRIGRRALALRTAEDRLTGDAIGQRIESTADRLIVVADAVTVWPRVPGADESAWLASIESELAEEMPDRYGALQAPWLGARLRALGVRVQEQRGRRVDGQVVNRAGVALSDLRQALERPATP